MSLRPEHLPRRSSNVFINYRREDSAGHAGRLFDRLSCRFPERVFMDIDTIEPGIDFVDTIEQAVGCCEVLIVVIGREWLNLKSADGRRRLEDPSDFVRLEIAAALDRNIRIIPVLVEDAAMPRAEDLPPDLLRLTRRNAIGLSDARWAFDVDRLIQAIEGVLHEKAPSAFMPVVAVPAGNRARPARWALSVPVVLALAGIGWSLVSQPIPRDSQDLAALSSAAPVMQPPAPLASPAVKARETARAPKEASAPRQGRVGSLFQKGKKAFKNLRDQAKRGSSNEQDDDRREEDRERKG